MTWADAGLAGGNRWKRCAVPGWPGEQAWPPQPTLAQTRTVLDGYAAAGGRYRQVVIPGSGHGPHLDQPEQFLAALREHLAGT